MFINRFRNVTRQDYFKSMGRPSNKVAKMMLQGCRGDIFALHVMSYLLC